jgi:hypothetical protein
MTVQLQARSESAATKVPLLAAFSIVAACWTREPLPAEATKPTGEPRPTNATHPGSPIVTSDATSPKEPRPPSDKALANELRVDGLNKLTALVSGPVVVLDLDAGAFTTLCGSAAVLAAQDWGRKLADPKRDEPNCVVLAPMQQVRCAQVVLGPRAATMNGDPDPELLVLGLGTAGRLRLTSAVVGRNHRKMALMDQLDAEVASASCP